LTRANQHRLVALFTLGNPGFGLCCAWGQAREKEDFVLKAKCEPNPPL
jgi:hypothetical protein